jgi:hypothetical protein
MLYRPTEIHQTNTTHLKSYQSNKYRDQHGHSSILLAFPSESLTHITCFLNPPSLLALGRTNRYLNNHVNDDNTWHRAFVCQFLGIGPEGDLRNTKTLMLRRCENSWSKEFIVRYNLRRCVIYFVLLRKSLTEFAGAGSDHITRQSLTHLTIRKSPECN